MARFLHSRNAARRILAASSIAGAYAATLLLSFACSSSESASTLGTSADAGVPRRDGGPVAPIDGSATTDAGLAPPPPSCTKYCDLVQKNCTGSAAQYASVADCLAFCAHLPRGEQPDESAGTLACRQYYAGSPARTDPAYCLAAGPFGGGLCGDRCTAFCEVTLSTCSPDAGGAPYASHPDCASACVGFSFRDAGQDGGGEGVEGPESGNTLNCRLFHLRGAVLDAGACGDLGVDAGSCR